MFDRFRYKFAEFMRGRYGVDQFGRFLSALTVILILINLFVPSRLLWWIIVLLIIYLYFRMFSRNIAKRYAENQRYLAYSSRVRGFFRDFKGSITHLKENREKNKGYHVYKCPRCGQKIRIPRGKGHIMVRCPKCGFEFHKKS